MPSLYLRLQVVLSLTFLSLNLSQTIFAHTSHASSNFAQLPSLSTPGLVQSPSPATPGLVPPSSSPIRARHKTKSTSTLKTHVPLTPPPATAKVRIVLKNAKVELPVIFSHTAWGTIITLGPNPTGLAPGSPYSLEIHAQGLSPSATPGKECQSTGPILGAPLGQVQPDTPCSPKSPLTCPTGSLAGMFGPIIGWKPPPRMIHPSLSLTDLRDRSLLLIDSTGQPIACCNFTRYPASPNPPPIMDPSPTKLNSSATTTRVVKRKSRSSSHSRASSGPLAPLPGPSGPILFMTIMFLLQ